MVNCGALCETMSRPPTKTPKQSTKAPAKKFFDGRYEHALDAKRRLMVPAEWRQQMGNPGHLYIMPDFKEKCLVILPPAEMDKVLEKLQEMPLLDPDVSAALACFGEHCERIDVDGAGRIRISDAFLQFANLETDAVLIGGVSRMRIWNPSYKPVMKQVNQAGFAQALKFLGV